jgi:hypothetical protein
MAVYPFSRRNIVIIIATFDTLLDTGAALKIVIVKNVYYYMTCVHVHARILLYS